MSLDVTLNYLDGILPRGDKYIKITFRNYQYKTPKVRGESTIYFGHHYTWPLARKIDNTDYLLVRVYLVGILSSDRVIGILNVGLGNLASEPVMMVQENLINVHRKLTENIVKLNIKYTSPFGGNKHLESDNFNFQIFDLSKLVGNRLPSEVSDDDDESLMYDDRLDGSQSQMSLMSDLSLLPERDARLPQFIDTEKMKAEHFEVTVTIIRAIELQGVPMNPFFVVTCNGKKRKTEMILETATPHYNQYMNFDVDKSRKQLMEEIVKVECYNRKNILLNYNYIRNIFPSVLLGQFSIDIRTVYSNENHSYFNKWAPLIDPKAPNTGRKGLVKLHISVLCPGDKPKKPTEDDNDDVKENIEKNIIRPREVSDSTKPLCTMSVMIYQAQDLPSMNSEVLSTIKQAVLGENVPLTNAYVEVCFAGFSGKTKPVDYSYNPEWNQKVCFTERFPFYVTRLRISVKNSGVRDETIATIHIELNKIMYSGKGEEAFLPTLGPAWVNLYGAPRTLSYDSMVSKGRGWNDDLEEGVAYRGRLMIAIKTVQTLEDPRIGVETYPCQPLSNSVAGKPEIYFLFGAIYEANLIPPEIGKSSKPITFQMSFGTVGNEFDVQGKQPVKTSPNLHSTTQERFCYTHDDEYFHVPYGNKKPTLFMFGAFEDHRPRMLIPNILEKMRFEFQNCIMQTYYQIEKERLVTAKKYLKGNMNYLIELTDNALTSIKSCRGTAKKTFLDSKYQRLVRFDLERMKKKFEELKSQIKRKNIYDSLHECEHLIKMMDEKIKYPMDGVPDIFISLIQDNKQLGYARLKARDLLYSVVDSEKGKMCGELNDVYLKRIHQPIKDDVSNLKIQAHLQIYLWFGFMKDMRAFKDGIPSGYRLENFQERLPAHFIEYTDYSMFRLHAYILKAKNVISSDESGLSDPFVRVVFSDSIGRTIIIPQTRNPEWDQTVVLDKIEIFFSALSVQENPPYVVLEIFDYDEDESTEFLGRVFVQPTVFLKDQTYEPPQLQWWKAYRGNIMGGEVLACCELLEMDPKRRRVTVIDAFKEDTLKSNTEEINETEARFAPEVPYRIPYGIRPHFNYFRMEMLIWGVRRMKRRRLMQVTRPTISIEFAGNTVTSNEIEDWNVEPNFSPNLIKFDLALPTNTVFWPALSIQCHAPWMFGKIIYVGNHSIENMYQYYSRTEGLDNELETEDNIEYSDEEMSVEIQSEDEEGIDNPGFEKEMGMDQVDTLKDGKDQLPNGTVPKETPGKVEKVTTIPQEELDMADWWTRYYATLEDMAKCNNDDEDVVDAKPKFVHPDLLEESQSEDEMVGDCLSDIEIEMEEDDDEDIMMIEEPDVKRRKKKKKKKKKKKLKLKNPFAKDPEVLFKGEEIDNTITLEADFVNDNSWIDRITFYTCELENIKDFGGFRDPFHSFNLYFGKATEALTTSEDRLGGVFKGNFAVYKIPEEELDKEIEDTEYRLFPLLTTWHPVEFIVRAYIIKGINLHPADYNGKADPYIIVRMDDVATGDRKNYRPKTLNPVFGQYFELTVMFPQKSFLQIQVYDYDITFRDDLIGETKIDLENRWLSKHMGACGYMPSYHNHGFLKWKNSQLPSVILRNLCTKHNLEPPQYDKQNCCVKVTDKNGDVKMFYAEPMIEDDDGGKIRSDEPLALEAIKNWHEVVPKCRLVPEHIETRPIYQPERPNIEQGLLEMWVDMFPNEAMPPAIIDVSPRQYINYELRITIMQTEKVRFADVNWLTNEKSVDIYLQGWVISKSIDLQKTDVHYRSLSGQGLFNYRFVFKFGYLKPEDAVVYTSKEFYELDGTEKKTPCLLTMQVMDSDLLSRDDTLGMLKFQLSRFPKPARSYKSCCVFQHSNDVAKFNLFRNKRVRGWWPLIYNLRDEDPDDENKDVIGGCVEMELELITAEEAESKPVGLGRDEPEPLPKPDRPDGSFLNMLNPLNTIKYFIKYKLKWILIKLLVITLAVLIIVLFIYNFPGNFTRVIVDKISGV